jgi:NADPH-dependent curcumin reductase CurA
VVVEHCPGIPEIDKIYKKVEEEIEPKLKEDEMLFKTLYVAVDLYLHGIALDTPINNCMGADSIMEVIEAGPKAKFKVGDVVQGFGGWQKYVIHNGQEVLWQTGTFPMVFPAYRKLNPDIHSTLFPYSTALGVLGGPGMAAWGTVSKVLQINKGESLVISGASGAVGEIVGQLAKLQGARVIGIVGSDEKIEHIKSLGFDAGINYKQANNFEKMTQALQAAAPNGIDRYFDNIGGYITDAVFPLLNVYGIVAICWQLATQLEIEPNTGPRLFPLIMFPRVTIRGIFALEWFNEKNWNELAEVVGGHINRGEIKYHEVLYEGFDIIPQAYLSLFKGTEKNRGKVIVKI